MTPVRAFPSVVHSLSSNSFVVLDASMLLCLSGLPSHADDYAEAVRFTNDVCRAGSVMLITVKTFEELAIRSTRILAGGRSERKRRLSTNPDLGQLIMTHVEQLSSLLSNNSAFISEPQGEINKQILERAAALVAKCNLEWGDAVTFAIAEDLRVNAIATLDLDYTRIGQTDIDIYLPSRLYETYRTSSMGQAPTQHGEEVTPQYNRYFPKRCSRTYCFAECGRWQSGGRPRYCQLFPQILPSGSARGPHDSTAVHAQLK